MLPPPSVPFVGIANNKGCVTSMLNAEGTETNLSDIQPRLPTQLGLCTSGFLHWTLSFLMNLLWYGMMKFAF
jgi:hypothetical protein